MGRGAVPYPVTPLARWHSVCGEKTWLSGWVTLVSTRKDDYGPVFLPLLLPLGLEDVALGVLDRH